MKNHRISVILIRESKYINLLSLISISKITQKEKRGTSISYLATSFDLFPKTKDQKPIFQETNRQSPKIHTTRGRATPQNSSHAHGRGGRSRGSRGSQREP